MPREAKGHVRWVNGIAIARIRVTPQARQDFALPTCTTEAEAQQRARVLADVARKMRPAGVELAKARKALEMIAGASARSLRNVLDVAEELVGGKLSPKGVPTAPTFGQIAKRWTSGELARQYPDQIKAKRSAHTDVSRLGLYVYPVLQNLPIDRVTLDHCEDVMRRMPVKLSVATRHRVAAILARVMSMAVYPLRLIDRSPIPRGFLPASSKRKALASLYPDEERRLMACTAVPLEYRLLWGFFAREGMREGEALALTWGDLDLERGRVRLEKNKTDDPRAWALSPGVAAALRAYRDEHRPGAGVNDLVFLAPSGQPISKYGLARLLREHLKLVGLEDERPELFTTTPERRRMCVHDLRGTMVTIALANGKSESWISDRTGHRSSVMIAKYKRAARSFAEIDLGDLAPLVAALPDFAIGHALATMKTTDPESATILVGHLGFEPRANGLRIHCSTS